MSTIPKFATKPLQAYASTEWDTEFTADNGVVVREVCVEYSHPTYGPVGSEVDTYHDSVFVKTEWVSYDF
jgi:hypothetical protein